MSCCLKLLLAFLICLKVEVAPGIALHKFVYQKDMSEYCRRRVMPSVFLGRQVIDAYSQILHFSRQELPFSCFVSIRTESGSNIILVIQLMSDESLIDSCRQSKNQLLVYEIGETFGGYWGALPETVMRRDSPKSKNEKPYNHYTMKTTQSTTTTTTEESTTQRRTTTVTTKEKIGSVEVLKMTGDQQEYFAVEVPIVNVSAKLVPGLLPSNGIFDPEKSFDTMFEATPWSAGMSYQTKMLPLVQFSIVDEVSVARTGDELGYRPRYEVDFNADIFTPDSRLIIPLLGSTTRRKLDVKYKYNVNRRLHFKKNKKKIGGQEALFYRRLTTPYFSSPSGSSRRSNIFTRPYDFMQPPLISQKETEPTSHSYEIIDAILKNLNKTKDAVSNTTIDKNLMDLLHGLAKIGPNESVFPATSLYIQHLSRTAQHITTKYRTDSITWRQPSASYRTNYLDEEEDSSKVRGLSQDVSKSFNALKVINNNESVINRDEAVALLPPALDVDRVILKVTNQKNNEKKIDENNIIKPTTSMLATEVSEKSTTGTTTIVRPLTLLDHESWENMVHAASVMAVMLNQSVTPSEDDKQGSNVTLANPSTARRKKRFIHAIPIEHARPHHLPVKMEVPSSTARSDKIADAQEFQRLIELQDDEIHDRVALRYLLQYVGPVLFNICDFEEAAARHVYLFNSSRLVLAITNFTLERMTVVMTPARTLLTSDARCTAAHLECQVSGARVCIDSLNACDGVPNCGSYDIYDEDRLMCGGSAGLQHNVCLAAITFLAVLLTVLYTVHYWLKRCVPKVSDAFFIYTDAAENVLYLDTIMRSAHDTEDIKHFYRGGAIQDYMQDTDIRITANSVAFLSRLFRFFGWKCKKRISQVDIIEEEFGMLPDVPRLISFGEVGLDKMASALVSDAAVQTSSSLEMIALRDRRLNDPISQRDSEMNSVAHDEGRRTLTASRSDLDMEISSNQPSDELSILKFFRRARSVSMQMPESAYEANIPAKLSPYAEEKEIQCLKLDRDDDQNQKEVSDRLMTVPVEITGMKPVHSLVQKKLRFEEELTKTMQSDVEEDTQEYPRRSITFGGEKSIQIDDTDLETDVDEQPSTSANREFKSYFWGSSKNKPKKPTKKKNQVSLMK